MCLLVCWFACLPSCLLARFFCCFSLLACLPLLARMHGLPGWVPDMEAADVLHTVWLGTARDACGSLILNVCDKHALFQEMETYDDRLHALWCHALRWCAARKIDSSCLEELSSLTARKTFCHVVNAVEIQPRLDQIGNRCREL